MDTVADLLHNLEYTDSMLSDNGRVTVSSFGAALADMFPYKSPERIATLVEASVKQLQLGQNEAMQYKKLFAEASIQLPLLDLITEHALISGHLFSLRSCLNVRFVTYPDLRK